MDESTGIATSLPSEAASSTANANSVPSETLSYPTTQSHIDMYPGHVEGMDMPSGERIIPLPELKAMLRQQLEYYFSRENLSTDAYLISQMDSDNYVPISTIAKFNQIRRLTEDISLVVEVLRESAVVQVDEAGEKVRPNPRSGVLILREIPESTPIKELEDLFSSANCPKFSRCEFAHNNSWYVLFDTDEDTQKAYRYLREEAKTFNGKPIMARIKAKAITSAPFTPSYKNDAPLHYTYTNEGGYPNQQVCPPFYPPTMLQTWAPSTAACVDLGTVLSVNGLSPQAAFRPLNNNTNRHNYASRDRPVKAYNPQNYNFSRSEQSRYLNSRTYLQRQQLHQQPFHNLASGFDYMPYTSRSRNVHNFGVDMNFFTAPNLYYSKLPSIYPTRHNPVLLPRNQVGMGAINNQDPLPNSAVAKQNAEAKDNWGPNQRQRGKRWWKESTSKVEGGKEEESPKFDLETTSFPPLPGCLESETADVDVFESRLADIVAGTVKPATRDSKTQTADAATKDSSTLTADPTPPPSPPEWEEASSITDSLVNGVESPESPPSPKNTLDVDTALLSLNGHADSESTVSSEDEKPFRKLTYSEVAMRAKEKVEKIAQELKEKERQEAMVRHHRQQEIVAQNKQAATRGPFREFPRGRVIEPRPGTKEWRRKPTRAVSLPTAGQ